MNAPSGLTGHCLALAIVAVVVVLAVAFASMIVGMGAYNVAADEPHWRPVYWLMQTVRDRSIAVRARDVAVPPDLGDAGRIAAGAGLYAEMCSGCHLAPGMEKTEISQGLYPAAPELASRLAAPPAEEFWTIKHGIKMTGMAAWGRTHSDTLIWDMVAFLQKLPTLSPAQYKLLAKNAPKEHEEMMDMPGMKGNDGRN